MQHSLPKPLQVPAVSAIATPTGVHTHDASGTLLDRFGAFLGFACAIHCIAVPLLFGVLPAFGLGLLADHHFDLTIIVIASICAVFAARSSWRAHHDRRVVAGFVAAIALLGLGHLIGEEGLAGRIPSIFGGVLLALTHLANLRMSRKACARAH